jgi:sortase A
LLFIVGIACIGLYCGDWLQRTIYQENASRDFDRAKAQSSDVSMADQPIPLRTAGAKRGISVPPRRASAGAVIGRLSLPRLHLTAMVREGVDSKTLRIAAGHIPSTALPGQPGNVGVAGHRDTLFRGLKDVRTNDEILFATIHGDYIYKVESLRIVTPNNVGVLAVSSEDVLTLVTCYPFYYVGNAPRRFIVRARQVSP